MSETYLIAADHEKLMRIAKLCARSPFPLDFGSRLDAISKRCVHNAFHYEVVEYARAAKNQTLLASTTSRIEELDALVARYD
jgi:hypothetical protein